MCLLSQITLTGWEPFLQLGFAAFVAIFLLWKHFSYADAIETNNRLNAIGDLNLQKNQVHILAVIVEVLHREGQEKNGEICQLIMRRLDQMQSDFERQKSEYEAEIRRKK